MKVKAFLKRTTLFVVTHPLVVCSTLSFAIAVLSAIGGVIVSNELSAFFYPPIYILTVFLVFPPMLTLYNLLYLVLPKRNERVKRAGRVCEYFTMISGALCTLLWVFLQGYQIIWNSLWSDQLYGVELHSPVFKESYLTLAFILFVSVAAYILLRVFENKNMPPLVFTILFGGIYMGTILCIVWIIQLAKNVILLCIYPLNIIFIFLKTLSDVVILRQDTNLSELSDKNVKFYKLRKLLNNSYSWTYIGFILGLPMLGLIVIFLTLFGQSPDSIIKAWTETADWTLSQKIAPENLPYDYHYLCTVAAGGHRKVVKPLRTGMRHGHKILVNRQLLVANAFEELISEKTPKMHRFIRKIYDKYGYPIAKHIRSPYAADIVWILMKPLEWFFLAVLYLFDTKPENRIAIQYPHSKVPK